MTPTITPGNTMQGLGYYRTSGLGRTAQQLAQFISSEGTATFQLAIILRAKFDAVSGLRDIYQDCSVPNWDAEGANPISDGAYREASRLIKLLPVVVPMPEIVPVPNGQIGLEWYLTQGRSFIVAVGGTQILTYAGQFGLDRSAHGTEPFTDSLPVSVVNNLQRLYS